MQGTNQVLREKVNKQLLSSGMDKYTANLATEYFLQTKKPINSKKSLCLNTDMYNLSDDFITVAVGMPVLDEDNETRTENYWKNCINGVIKGDMEHHHSDILEGKRVLPQLYDGFTTEMYETEYIDGKLIGKVKYAKDHPYTETFEKQWENGELGVSIEAKDDMGSISYDDNFNPVIDNGEVYRYSFTETPALPTKPDK